jgi:hypothetical protein
MPRRTGGFIGNSPLGVRQGCRTLLEGQESLPVYALWVQTPIKPTERRKQAASGGFLLDTFLWQKIAPAFSAKESISPVGTRTHI